MYYYDSTRPPMPSSGTMQHHLLPQITVEQYLQSCKGQYIRTNMSGSGTIIARLLGYDNTSGMVQLDIAYPRYLAGFIEVHRSDLTGISCLGWTLPPQYSQPRPPMPSSGTIQPHLLPQTTVEQYLQSCKGQYIRTNMSGSGTIIARLLGYDNTSGMVQLDIAYPRYLAGFIEVHRSDLTGISCLGWTLPPQYRYYESDYEQI